jgi:hypothetical protein
MNEILSILSILGGTALIVAVVQHETNLSPVEYLDTITGRNYRFTKIFGREIRVNV